MKKIYHHFPLLDSTNAYAMKQLKTWDPSALTILTADEQTAGRGQYGRKWFSPKNVNIYASICFFIPIKKQEDLPIFFTHMFALSVLEILKENNLDAVLKWPNDIKIENKKLAGILCETSAFSSKIAVVIGLGMNVNMPPDLLELIDQPATSLLVETGNHWDLISLLEKIVDNFAKKLKPFV